jgi:hypothetical protein
MLLHESVREPDDSPIRVQALKIWTMREAGVSDAEISAALQLSRETIYSYIYRASKNGWLEFNDPKDSLEFQLLPKATRVLNEALDGEVVLTSGMKEKTAVALKLAEGALYPKVVQAPPTAPALVGIKIQIVGGEPGTMREGTVMGNSTYIDAEQE